MSTRTSPQTSSSQPKRAQKIKLPKIVKDPIEAAKVAGLRYVSDDAPGIRRLKRGDGFRYVDGDGKAIRDRETLARIRTLAMPPAYENVWICADASGHLQATGIDARGRKQYRYHARWREVRDETKYTRMLAFGAALPQIRERTNRDTARNRGFEYSIFAADDFIARKIIIVFAHQVVASARPIVQIEGFGEGVQSQRFGDIHVVGDFEMFRQAFAPARARWRGRCRNCRRSPTPPGHPARRGARGGSLNRPARWSIHRR